ncbi:hypothetical protein Gasu2_04460 [Galdieria sulphuraria]|nr:hypothetical protein Gasu2_04460 [Galdieria sulphuraria]
MLRRLSRATTDVDLSEVLLLPNTDNRAQLLSPRVGKISRFGSFLPLCVGVCTLGLVGVYVSLFLSGKLFWFRKGEFDFISQSSLIYGPRNGSSSNIYAEVESRLIPHFRFVTVSSDDWGRFSDAIPLFPNILWKQQNGDISTASGSPWEYGTVETKEDLQRLLQVLESLNKDVAAHERVVLTPFFIVSGPDISEMKLKGCPESSCVYVDAPIYLRNGGSAKYPFLREGLEPQYKELFSRRFWHPEYHGRAHFDVLKWFVEIQTPDSIARKCFERGLVCGNNYSSLRSEHSMFSSPDKNPDTEVTEYMQWISVGLHAFMEFWGYKPTVISSPHNTWSSSLLQSVFQLGFIGAELGDDQTALLESFNTYSHLSLINRFRYDAFYPEFQFSSRLEQLISHMNETRFTSLLWHAQNSLSSCFDSEYLDYLSSCFVKTIEKLRQQDWHVVFLTSSELHQVRRRGWSREVWMDRLVYRNFLTKPMAINVDDLSLFIRTNETWSNHVLRVQLYSYLNETFRHFEGQPNFVSHRKGRGRLFISVYDTLILPPGSYVEVTAL